MLPIILYIATLVLVCCVGVWFDRRRERSLAEWRRNRIGWGVSPTTPPPRPPPDPPLRVTIEYEGVEEAERQLDELQSRMAE